MKTVFSFLALTLVTILSLFASENPEVPPKETLGKVNVIILEDGSIIRAQDVDSLYFSSEGNQESDWEGLGEQAERGAFFLPHDILMEMSIPTEHEGPGENIIQDFLMEYLQNGAGSGGFTDKGTVKPSYPAGSGGFTEGINGDYLIEYARDSGAGSGGPE